MNLGFAWNTKKIKTVVNTQDRGQVQIEISASTIVKEPNRHRMESIIHALCITVSEMIEINEAQAKRIIQMQEAIRGKNGSEENNRSDLGRDNHESPVQ